jgi:hypothetical protein
MKRNYFQVFTFLLIATLLFSASSYKKQGFLYATTTTNLTQGTIFKDNANAAGFLANIWAGAGFSGSASRVTHFYVLPGSAHAGLLGNPDQLPCFVFLTKRNSDGHFCLK